MTKSQIVRIIAEGTGLTRMETQAVIDGFLATVNYALYRRERVDLRGFGVLKVVKRKSRIARKPSTGELVHVPEHLTVAFRPSQDLKKFVNRDDESDPKIPKE